MQNQKKAELTKRLIAALIDGIISSIIAVIPVIGAIIGAAYTLTKDGIMFQVTKDAQWKNRSIGKKLLGLEVVTASGAEIDIVASCMRNWPLAIGIIIMIVPIIGWVIGGLLAFVLGMIELVLVLIDPKGRRLGDKTARTMVVESATAQDAA
ncbi:MAG: RDD domain containing protein [Bacillota bacterium]|nr:MAG: RDD domain containing protein [Bacillota bacterium]